MNTYFKMLPDQPLIKKQNNIIYIEASTQEVVSVLMKGEIKPLFNKKPFTETIGI